jgi:diguanylate cyclase (GGDEF)-like protein
MIDVDRFKEYNDRNGHPAGDEVLRRVALILAEERRANDIVARYGGEEFAVLLTETSAAAARVVAEQCREQVQAARFSLQSGAEDHVTISVGVAAFPQHAETVQDLVLAADAALYRAKRAGRNRAIMAQERSE